MPREQLAEVLWGAAPPPTWEKALTVLVSKLRALLSENGIDGASALTAAFGCYRLALPDGSWVDIVAAADATAAAEIALAMSLPEEAKSSAEVAESLIRQPFLPGDDGTWVEEKRRELAEVRSRALSVLADACLRTGDESEAARWAADAVALEPFRELAYRQLMEAHIAAGNRAEALRVYEGCRRLLADELGTYPSPETESIYRRLLEQTPQQVPDREKVVVEKRRPERTSTRSSLRRRSAIVAAASVVIAGVAAAGIYAMTRTAAHTNVTPNSIVSLDESGSVGAVVPVGARPVAVAAGAG